MEFRILGPLEVVRRGTTIGLHAAKQRALLGVLLLHANEVVSSKRLIDELWGERPPTTAAKTLQTYVSQLRRLLGREVIVTRPPGYMLRVQEHAVDSLRFRRLTAKARHLAADGKQEQAHAVYVESLALWRGPPLADVAFESFARHEVERLEEERFAALTERIDCELALGRHDDVIAELKTLVHHYPLRERLWAQLMVALYRAARQADALAAYQEARRTFVDRLGLEPSPEVQSLERAILTHDATLEPPTPPVRERGRRRQRRSRRALAVATLGLLAAAVGFVAFAVADKPAGPTLLAPNSVGFVDAESGRLTRSFRVGDKPMALAVVNDAVWAANFRDQTVMRVHGKRGRSRTIEVGGRPIAMTVHRGTLWVWTENGLLVPIDPRFARVGDPIRLRTPRLGGRVTAGAGSLWVTVPGGILFGPDPAHPKRVVVTFYDPGFVIRVNPANPARPIVVRPNNGADGPITFRDGEIWAAGSGSVFPITGDTGRPGSRTRVGAVLDLAAGTESLWVLSRSGWSLAGVMRAGRRGLPLPTSPPHLRRVDPQSRSVDDPIEVGERPVAVAVAAGSVWVAGVEGRGGTINRVDPLDEEVVDTIRLGARPTALAADRNGVWVAFR
jgi:DNA-binding SARP family transcriptional activator